MVKRKVFILIIVVLLSLLSSFSCSDPEYDKIDQFIESSKYKITTTGINNVYYTNSYIIQDGFVVIEEYASAHWDRVFPIEKNKLMLPIANTIIKELR